MAVYKFASGTKVSAQDTMQDIREQMERHGADEFIEYTDKTKGFTAIGFQTEQGAFLLYVMLPDVEKFSPKKPPVATTGGQKASYRNRYEQEYARILRALFNLIKMKLVAIDEGITTIEKEFFSDLVVWNADGRQQTVYEWYAPQVQHLRGQGLMPPVLPAIESPKLIPGNMRQIEGK